MYPKLYEVSECNSVICRIHRLNQDLQDWISLLIENYPHGIHRMFSDESGYFFNELENYAKLIVIKNALKCYTSVTFGVQFASATNIVTVRVHRRFCSDSFFGKK